MNLLHLQYFYVVAKENGFTNASKALRIQQPAISRMVRMLEEDFGFRLFEKVGRHVQLTKQGHEVFEHCKSIFGAVESLKQSLGQISGDCKGPLKIAAAEPIASHFIPTVLKDYLKSYPKVYPQIYSATATMLFDRIASGEIDFGIFFHIPDLPDKLEIFLKKDIRFHLVVRSDLKKSKNVLESFIGSREVDDTTTRQFPTLERIRKDGIPAEIKISSNNLTAHREMVLQGLGISILPDFLVAKDLKSRKLVDLYSKETFKFQMKFIKRKTSVLSKAMSEFIKHCMLDI